MAVIRKLRCQVEWVAAHGSQVYTLELAPERRLPAFRPGQFLQLAIDPYDPSDFWPESRAFSIASPPEPGDRLRLTYAVKGAFTARMERELAPGAEVWVKLPYGDFVVSGPGPVVLVAGGTGITAFSAWIETLGAAWAGDAYLFYGARSLELLIYREAAADAARRSPGFHPEYFVEVPPAGHIPGEIQPRVGRLSIAQIWSGVPDPLAATYYLSGPPAMLKTFSAELSERGVRAERIRIDAWE